MTVATDSPALDAAPAPTPEAGRVQLALNVDDLGAAVAFYSKFFGTPPAKVRPGYANFAVASPPLKLVLLENPGKGGTINHLGVEVTDSATVRSEIARLTGEGLFTDKKIGTTCCFATQDKVWVTGPAGERWEVYTILSDTTPLASARRPSPQATPTAADLACAAAQSRSPAGLRPAQPADFSPLGLIEEKGYPDHGSDRGYACQMWWRPGNITTRSWVRKSLTAVIRIALLKKRCYQFPRHPERVGAVRAPPGVART